VLDLYKFEVEHEPMVVEVFTKIDKLDEGMKVGPNASTMLFFDVLWIIALFLDGWKCL